MTTQGKIGIAFIILGIAMFLLGASLFTYQGPTLHPAINNLGQFSFMFWLPTLILGIVLATLKGRQRRRDE